MYTGGGRYSTQWFITDGGNSGESASKCYACGNNTQGEMGTGSDLADGNASGNWKLKEIEFDSGPEIMTIAHNSTQVTGTKSTFDSAGFYNNDNSIDFHSTNDYTTRFVKCYTQPEPFIDLSFYNKAGEAEVSYMGVGESGQVYVGGYGGWSNLGNKTTYSMDGWTKLLSV